MQPSMPAWQSSLTDEGIKAAYHVYMFYPSRPSYHAISMSERMMFFLPLASWFEVDVEGNLAI